MQKSDIIIVGAGASGLMAARELSRVGKKVIILEARDRIGGRIYPLSEGEFGYPVQGGAEFVHGEAKITQVLFKEAGITTYRTQADMWDSKDGKLMINGRAFPYQDELSERLNELEEDMSLADFLEKYFSDKKYEELCSKIIRVVENYDAADPRLISTMTLRDEWLAGQEWLQFRVKEGYGALLSFLQKECDKNSVGIYLNSVVKEVNFESDLIKVSCADGSSYEADKVIVTVPVSVIKEIEYIPAIPGKLEAASKIGFGGVIKILLKFKNKWWVDILKKDFSEMDFIYSHEIVSIWWTQYPDESPVLTGWLAGPKTSKFVNSSSDEIVEESINSLANILSVDKQFLRDGLVTSKVANWPADPYSRGAYSYWTCDSEEAQKELVKPIQNKVFFAGEALCSGGESATVEGALASGKEAAGKVLNGGENK